MRFTVSIIVLFAAHLAVGAPFGQDASSGTAELDRSASTPGTTPEPVSLLRRSLHTTQSSTVDKVTSSFIQSLNLDQLTQLNSFLLAAWTQDFQATTNGDGNVESRVAKLGSLINSVRSDMTLNPESGDMAPQMADNIQSNFVSLRRYLEGLQSVNPSLKLPGFEAFFQNFDREHITGEA
ncbi:MAG: hypothetical protein M1829_000293 [Trizodia sp. TS-e1964]|nr:MAG: hypothetical protein M1829_000293 [Trizodia sp. TS-e1964]